jgi:hypothetical protein
MVKMAQSQAVKRSPALLPSVDRGRAYQLFVGFTISKLAAVPTAGRRPALLSAF